MNIELHIHSVSEIGDQTLKAYSTHHKDKKVI